MPIGNLRLPRARAAALTAVVATAVPAPPPSLSATATAAPDDQRGWVTGVVVDTTGAPVPGAMVNVLPPREVPEAGMLDETTDRWTVTDARGRFRVRQASQDFLVQVCDHDTERPWACVHPSAADHLLRYVGPDGERDSWVQHTRLFDASSSDLALGTVELQPPARVEGTLSGARFEQVEVMRLDDTVAFHGATDGAGRFSIEGLAPGTYYLRAGGRGTVPWRSEPVTVTADRPAVVDGVLDRGTTLVGTMVDRRTGAPARRTEVFLGDADGDLVASRPTTRRGTFRFTGLTPGTYRVGVLRRGGPYLARSVRVRVAAGDRRVDATVPVRRGATATVRFVTDGGRIDNELRDGRGEVVATNLGRDNGVATYVGLRPGRYTVVAKDGDGYATRTFRVRGLRAHDVGRLRLERPLLTLRGRTAPGAVVEATTGDLCPPDLPPTYGGFHEISDRADAQGRYVLPGLVPGDYMVGADAFPHEQAPVCHEDVKVWASRRYDVPLAEGHTVTGRLVYAGTTRPVITGIGYEVTYPVGLPTNPTGEHPARIRTRGASGRFTIPRLPAGEATGGLALTPHDEVSHPSLWVFFPSQYGTPYWLEAEERPLTIDGDIALGDVELTLRTGAEELPHP
ncbi:carboxypeptidase-like regulatory domain-containing protein [Nocardioides sp. TF02-7]|uniref:carboxypeptidase-like regulatory domain-containing protein n=1 Tax=Nocardioides sp. TF02-7 TaxID=2917724 RepID=UPI001F05FF3A|nr:carboxypeptidase-like regulatory domain-containing protein [Nocardioides sp. TF02-7]UMG94078.1 carboxypeptidase-like regulatory domain-containing protein [Nocardioides sp. TF02-7]